MNKKEHELRRRLLSEVLHYCTAMKLQFATDVYQVLSLLIDVDSEVLDEQEVWAKVISEERSK